MWYRVLPALASAIEMGWYPEVVSACSSTTVSAYLNCPCCSLGCVCGVCVLLPSGFPFHSVFWVSFLSFFNFHSEAASGPLHCWLTLVAELHLLFYICITLHCCRRKQFCPVPPIPVLTCPLQLPIPLCVCAAVGICAAARWVGLGRWPCQGLKKASVELS